MKIPIYQIDAFAEQPFTGNPAAVCLLPHWLEDGVLQSIAEEMNLSETAFLVKQQDYYELRWFTPVCEVDLCGHASLAAAFVVMTETECKIPLVQFQTRSGPVIVSREGERFVLDFPSMPPAPCERPLGIEEALGVTPLEILAARDYFVVLPTETHVRELQPDLEILKNKIGRSVIVTAPGDHADFVSRFFAPDKGIPEDPVTGSAHCSLIPYWTKVLHKKQLYALQVSKRTGEIFCEEAGERVLIGGHAIKVMEGTLFL